jgi:3-oxoadipate CoA-transferase, beta subunit
VSDRKLNGIGWSREAIARNIANDLPDGAVVNLGIGMPEKVVECIPEGREVLFHTENGLLGMGPSFGRHDPELINAGKNPVTAVPGAAYFHHADSFAMVRGGHIDICVLGAMQVSQTGTSPIGRWVSKTPLRPSEARWIWWRVSEQSLWR